jgi:hypothetical protein
MRLVHATGREAEKERKAEVGRAQSRGRKEREQSRGSKAEGAKRGSKAEEEKKKKEWAEHTNSIN